MSTEAAVWKCLDGRQIAVTDMDTAHIKNTLAMLNRKGFVSPQDAARMVVNPPSGDHAHDAWESELDTLRVSPFIPIFEKELAARGETV